MVVSMVVGVDEDGALYQRWSAGSGRQREASDAVCRRFPGSAADEARAPRTVPPADQRQDGLLRRRTQRHHHGSPPDYQVPIRYSSKCQQLQYGK